MHVQIQPSIIVHGMSRLRLECVRVSAMKHSLLQSTRSGSGHGVRAAVTRPAGEPLSDVCHAWLERDGRLGRGRFTKTPFESDVAAEAC